MIEIVAAAAADPNAEKLSRFELSSRSLLARTEVKLSEKTSISQNQSMVLPKRTPLISQTGTSFPQMVADNSRAIENHKFYAFFWKILGETFRNSLFTEGKSVAVHMKNQFV